MKKYFITGTDTNSGKTTATLGLLTGLSARGFSTLGIKPIATGTIDTPEGRVNEDAMALRQASSVKLPYAQINPLAFALAASPHISAHHAGTEITVNGIIESCQIAIKTPADYLFIEGIGGWFVPLNERETLADLAIALNVPVILVVGMRLGCLNHALLTYASLLASGLPLAGWIANRLDPMMPAYPENVDTLKQRIAAPYLGEIPYLDKPSSPPPLWAGGWRDFLAAALT